MFALSAGKRRQTLKRTYRISPSWTTYSFPSSRHFASVFSFSLEPQREKILARDHFGADEPLLHVGMDLPRRVDGDGPAPDVPRPPLVLAHRHEADGIHGLERAADELVPRRTRDPHLLEKKRLLFRRQPRNLLLDPGRQADQGGASRGCRLLQFRKRLRGEVPLGHVQHQEKRYLAQEPDPRQNPGLLAGEGELPERNLPFQGFHRLAKGGPLGVPPGLLRRPLDPLLGHHVIGDDEFRLDRPELLYRGQPSRGSRVEVVGKPPEDERQDLHSLDPGHRLGRKKHRVPGVDLDERDRNRGNFFGAVDGGQPVQAVVEDLDRAHPRPQRRNGRIPRSASQRPEQGAFPDSRVSEDSDPHGFPGSSEGIPANRSVSGRATEEKRDFARTNVSRRENSRNLSRERIRL